MEDTVIRGQREGRGKEGQKERKKEMEGRGGEKKRGEEGLGA